MVARRGIRGFDVSRSCLDSPFESFSRCKRVRCGTQCILGIENSAGNATHWSDYCSTMSTFAAHWSKEVTFNLISTTALVRCLCHNLSPYEATLALLLLFPFLPLIGLAILHQATSEAMKRLHCPEFVAIAWDVFLFVAVSRYPASMLLSSLSFMAYGLAAVNFGPSNILGLTLSDAPVGLQRHFWPRCFSDNPNRCRVSRKALLSVDPPAHQASARMSRELKTVTRRTKALETEDWILIANCVGGEKCR